MVAIGEGSIKLSIWHRLILDQFHSPLAGVQLKLEHNPVWTEPIDKFVEKFLACEDFQVEI